MNTDKITYGSNEGNTIEISFTMKHSNYDAALISEIRNKLMLHLRCVRFDYANLTTNIEIHSPSRKVLNITWNPDGDNSIIITRSIPYRDADIPADTNIDICKDILEYNKFNLDWECAAMVDEYKDKKIKLLTQQCEEMRMKYYEAQAKIDLR